MTKRTREASPLTPPATGVEPEKANKTHQPFRNAAVSFAVDISGSTFGPTLAAEMTFVRSVSNLLSPLARLDSKVIPWDDRAHPILSLARLNTLEDRGGTDPRVLLADVSHKTALQESSLWFLLTDGLIPEDTRIKFARDVANHGMHGTSCVVVIFGNPSTGPASCDISVGIGIFSVVPNCAFLFCNETNGSLRVMQTKGTFNILLKGQPHPVFDSSSRWDSLPQISVADFAAVAIPPPQRLGSNEVALQDSLVIDMNDLFANRLSPDQVTRIFSNLDSLDSVRLTMQARNQQDGFRHWLQQQTIRPDDPLFKPRLDQGAKAESLFMELIDLVSRGKSSPPPLQARLRAAYLENMNRFIADRQGEVQRAGQRQSLIQTVSSTSHSPINTSPSLRSPVSRIHYASAPLPASAGGYRSAPQPVPQHYYPSAPAPVSAGQYRSAPQPVATPSSQMISAPSRQPGAPRRMREAEEEPWNSWEAGITDASLRGLLYTPGLRSTKGSFKGICLVCGASNMTLAWLFRSPAFSPSTPLTPATPETPGGTAGFPPPQSRTRLAFPLAMGHFPETSGVIAPLSTLDLYNFSPQNPMLVCEPCSTFYTRNGALSFGVTAALPLVRFTENREAVCSALATAFEGRFAEADLPHVFLSVLILTTEKLAQTPRAPPTPPSEIDFDIPATMAAAAAVNIFRAAVEWTARDLLYSVVALRELSESFSLPSDTPPQVWPLATVLAGSFEELDASSIEDEHVVVPPLLRYPLPGFIVILKAAPLISVGIESRRRATFRRLLYLLCEELNKAADQVPHSQAVSQLIRGLLGFSPPTGSNSRGGQLEGEPVLSVTIQSLRSTYLLSAANYNMLYRVEEFRYLEDPSTVWVGPAIALFLHGLFLTVKANPRMGASETFHAVRNMEFVGNALLRPEEVDHDDVLNILSQIQK